MSGISLTASMRSNLLSLQNISGQVSSTQNKLSTGNKVNSAIDNPSSYYTALSLNNRADDLNALLDSMGQAVSTIKAATTALESATDFLEQATAIATQVNCSSYVPEKSYFEDKVGENGAVVTTAQELKDAIAAGKETICVYGAIDLGDISTTGGLELKENQKLVGVGYFGNYDTDKFSSISASAETQAKHLIVINQANSFVGDLDINYTRSTTKNDGFAAIRIEHIDATLKDININANFSGIHSNYAQLDLEGEFNIITDTELGRGLSIAGGECRIAPGTIMNIRTLQPTSSGIKVSNTGNLSINSESSIRINNKNASGIDVDTNSSINIAKGANIHLKSENSSGLSIRMGTINIGGNLYIHSGTEDSIYNSQGTCNIMETAQLYMVYGSGKSAIVNNKGDESTATILDIAASAKLAIEKDGNIDWYEITESFHSVPSTTIETITNENIRSKIQTEKTSSWKLPEEYEDKTEQNKESALSNVGDTIKNYQEIINQYDALIKDASYKGINLLQNDKLTVKFNEDNTASLNVQGKDMSSQALGLTVFDWQTQADIADSLAEIASALKSIRNYSAELGNNYSIITTRQDFTDSLINVLTEGADKLTLADMNEESANMLALQTRQQLAINSLSLASQASQSILKLF